MMPVFLREITEQEEVVIQCYTQQEYNKLMQILEENEIYWATGTRATNNNFWDINKHNTCINIIKMYKKTIIRYSEKSFYEKFFNKKILPFQILYERMKKKKIRKFD